MLAPRAVPQWEGRQYGERQPGNLLGCAREGGGGLPSPHPSAHGDPHDQGHEAATHNSQSDPPECRARHGQHPE